MMGRMDDLVQFLRARLDEDERIARRACEYAEAEWRLDEEFGETVLWWPPELRVAEKEREHGLPVVSDQWRGQTIESDGTRIAPHIARHDPARVLRDVEAKRGILDHCRQAIETSSGSALVLPVLLMLAVPYSEHPDYREGWRP